MLPGFGWTACMLDICMVFVERNRHIKPAFLHIPFHHHLQRRIILRTIALSVVRPRRAFSTPLNLNVMHLSMRRLHDS